MLLSENSASTQSEENPGDCTGNPGVRALCWIDPIWPTSPASTPLASACRTGEVGGSYDYRRVLGDVLAYATDPGMVTSTSVPESRSLQTASLPPTTLTRSCMPGNP